MKMVDKAETRLNSGSVTSFSKDRDVSYQGSTSNIIPLIRCTIGSAQLTLRYDKEEDRDNDFERLNTKTRLDGDDF